MSEFDWMARQAQRALLWARPDGGQGRARRNAWSAMVSEHNRRAQRIEADRAVRAAALPGKSAKSLSVSG
jgi:hypothetical protein